MDSLSRIFSGGTTFQSLRSRYSHTSAPLDLSMRNFGIHYVTLLATGPLSRPSGRRHIRALQPLKPFLTLWVSLGEVLGLGNIGRDENDSHENYGDCELLLHSAFPQEQMKTTGDCCLSRLVTSCHPVAAAAATLSLLNQSTALSKLSPSHRRTRSRYADHPE